MSDTNPNLHWPVYQNLERAVDELTFAIHFEDDQLGVYSSEIIDLILRAATEIESIAKELHIGISGTTKDRSKIKFDKDALADLIPRWDLEAKVVLISSPNMFFTDSELRPLAYNSKNGWGDDSWEWNTTAYQALKHDRAASMKHGNVKHLIEIMAALYLLNLYYRDQQYEAADAGGTSLDRGFGSRVFSVGLDSVGYRGSMLLPGTEYARSAYLVVPTDDFLEKWVPAMSKMSQLVANAGPAEPLNMNRMAIDSGVAALWNKGTYVARLNRNYEVDNS